MMEQFNLNWHTYTDHLKEMMHSLMEAKNSTDVTLVCDDKNKLRAHKFVLSACSPMFHSIIEDLPQKDSVIYLRGVLSQEMKAILQFMYLGQATFYQDRMNDVLKVARSLEIKELGKDVSDSLLNQKIDTNQDSQKENSNDIVNHTPPSNNIEETDLKGTIRNYLSEAGKFRCNKCDRQFSLKFNLQQHFSSLHEGIRFSCQFCNNSYTRKTNLMAHIKDAHGHNNTQSLKIQ